jgi:hypothetical protein
MIPQISQYYLVLQYNSGAYTYVNEGTGVAVVLLNTLLMTTSLVLSFDSMQCCHSGVKALRWAGNVSCTGLPSSFWAGDMLSLHKGYFYIDEVSLLRQRSTN